jgi:hypothetical protein
VAQTGGRTYALAQGAQQNLYLFSEAYNHLVAQLDLCGKLCSGGSLVADEEAEAGAPL